MVIKDISVHGSLAVAVLFRPAEQSAECDILLTIAVQTG